MQRGFGRTPVGYVFVDPGSKIYFADQKSILKHAKCKELVTKENQPVK